MNNGGEKIAWAAYLKSNEDTELTDTTAERELSDNETKPTEEPTAEAVTRLSPQQSNTADTATPSGANSAGSVTIERQSPDIESLSERYDMDVSRREATKLQRLEDEFGAQQVSEWADEGMPVETMGKARDMQAFRKRQQERSAEIPADIKRRNEASVQRNATRNRDDGLAGDTEVPDSVREVISSPGESLDPAVQREMKEQMNDEFSDVQIHAGPAAANAAEDINAKAFTVGTHVVFNQGEYDPSSAEGQHTIAHELAHVRQQTGGAVSMLPQEGKLRIDPDERLEREAEQTAEQVVRGGAVGVHRMCDSDLHIQRWRNQPRDHNGRFDEKDRQQYDGKRYDIDCRPLYAPGQVQRVWQQAKSNSLDGTVRDPNTNEVLH